MHWASCAQAEAEFNREKTIIQDRLAQELVERQKRSSKAREHTHRATSLARWRGGHKAVRPLDGLRCAPRACARYS